MKMSFAFAALLCVSASSSYAQIQILGHTAGNNQLASNSAPISLEDDSALAADSYEPPMQFAEISDSSDSIGNFGSSGVSENIDPSSLSPEPAQSEVNTSNESARNSNGLPVGRRHGRSIVDTILDQSVVNSAPMAVHAPQQWCHETCRNSAIGDMLTRPSCVQGLWNGYEAERAAECARKQNRLNGYHHHCQACTAVAAGCQSCGPIPNRYRAQRPVYIASAPQPCDSQCDSQCDSVAGTSASTQLHYEPIQMNAVPHNQPTPAPALSTGYQSGLQPFTPPTPAPESSAGKIAYLPLPYLNR